MEMKGDPWLRIRLFGYAAMGAWWFGMWQDSVAAGLFCFCAIAVLDQRS